MFSRRDFLKVGGATLIGAALSSLKVVRAEDADLPPIIYRGSARHRYVALTYDDCSWLLRMHDIEKALDDYPDFRITLFPTGENIVSKDAQDPGIFKRFYDKGHDIGYHSWDHQDFATLSPEAMRQDYDKWLEAYSNAMGFEPEVKFARPTYGNPSRSFDILCKERGLVEALWSAAGGGETSTVMKNTFHAIKNGDIVLFHFRQDAVDTSLEAFPYLKEQGIGVVTLSQLYDDLLLEQINSEGCDIDADTSLLRTCVE